MQNDVKGAVVPRAAATVMLVRDRPTAGIEVYLARRNSRSAFMPDAYVFPGGALDDADASAEATALLAGSPDGLPPPYAVAALRELFEEAGILLALRAEHAPLTAEDLASLNVLRAEIGAGTPFVQMLAQRSWRLDGARLAYYSRWVTPLGEPRRFDARFFVARAPGDQEALADAVELHDGLWCTPQTALKRGSGNEFALAFPTRLHLERLAQFSSVDELERAARTRQPFAVMPTVRADGTIELPPGFAEW